MEPLYPIEFSLDSVSQKANMITEDGLFDEMANLPADLIGLFEKACAIENQWHLHKPEFISKLCSRFHRLSVEDALSMEQRQRVAALIENIFFSSNESVQDQLSSLFMITMASDVVSELEKGHKLKRFLSCKIIESTALQKTAQEYDISLERVPEIPLEKLLELYDNINFSDPQKAGYRNPQNLSIDGIPTGTEQLRVGIELLVERIKNEAEYTSVPAVIADRKKWYRRLDILLRVIIQKMEEVDDVEAVTDGLIRLGGAAYQCGSRWLGEAADVKKSLDGSWEADSVEEILQSWNDSYKEGILSELALEYTPRAGNGNHPHVFNLLATIFTENNIALPARVIYEPNDANMPHHAIGQAEVMKRLMGYYSPLALARYYRSMIQATNNDNKAKIIESLRNYALDNLIENERHKTLKSHFDRTNDAKMKGAYLVDILEREELLEYDDAKKIYHVTLLGACVLLKHFGYFS